MRIALDAMGSDTRPVPDVEGAVLAAKETRDTIILVGDEARIRPELAKYPTAGLAIEVHHAPHEVLMADKPSLVVKEKPESSMHIGMNLVKEGHADAFVTAGNTGAAYAIAMLHTLRRIPGVKRPALSIIFPVQNKRIIFLDVGANADAKPEWLVQFAIMGNIYAQKALGLANPRIAVLSNGEEEGKGNQLIKETDLLLRQLGLNYIGNVEPQDIYNGRTEVVVTDGFTGNILIKTFETTARYLTSAIRDELTSNVFTTIGALLARPAFRRVRTRMDPSEVGGAPLLGVNGVVIIGHGNSNALAIKNAVLQARRAVQGQIIDSIQQGIADLSIELSGDK